MLTKSNIQLCKCSVPPVDFTTANVGNVISAGPTLITGTVADEIFFSIDPSALGGSTLIQTNKVFFRNTSTTDTALNCSVYIENFIDAIVGPTTITLQSTSASDDSTFFARIKGFDASGNPIQTDLSLAGTSAVTSVQTFSTLSRIDFRNSTSEALTPVNGDITVKYGSTTIGICPAGLRTASHEFSILMESSLNSSTTIATTAANPTGTFFQPRTEATALAFYADLSHVGSPNAQGMWPRVTIPPATLGSERYDFSLRFLCKVA